VEKHKPSRLEPVVPSPDKNLLKWKQQIKSS
jgi:hypothetical protein